MTDSHQDEIKNESFSLKFKAIENEISSTTPNQSLEETNIESNVIITNNVTSSEFEPDNRQQSNDEKDSKQQHQLEIIHKKHSDRKETIENLQTKVKSNDYRLFGFGSNYFHALADAQDISLSTTSSHFSTQLSSSSDLVSAKEWNVSHLQTIDQVYCTSSSTLLRTVGGKIYQVGMMHGHIHPKFHRVPIRQPIIQISGGRHFCVALSSQGSIFTWGAGHFGQLGHGPNIGWIERPHPISTFQSSSIVVTSIHSGAWHTVARLQDGRLYTWGSNRRHQCGLGGSSKSSTMSSSSSLTTTQYHPICLDTLLRFSTVACGRSHTLAVTMSGQVYAWGSRYGCGRSANVTSPRLVEALQRVAIVQVAAGDHHSLALTAGGRVFSWGAGSEGQLGIGAAITMMPRPKLVSDLDFVAIIAGRQHQQQRRNSLSHSNKSHKSFENLTVSSSTLVAEDAASCLDASMKSFSVEPSSSLPVIPSSIHAPVSSFAVAAAASKLPASTRDVTANHVSNILSNVPKVIQIFAAGTYSMALSSSGHVYAWGSNDAGNLGLVPTLYSTVHSPSSSSSTSAPPTLTTPNLPIVEAVSSATTMAQIKGRILEGQTFDSRHNVLLPKRIDALQSIRITHIAGGPSHIVLGGNIRDTDDPIGQTLFELQNSRQKRSSSLNLLPSLTTFPLPHTAAIQSDSNSTFQPQQLWPETKTENHKDDFSLLSMDNDSLPTPNLEPVLLLDPPSDASITPNHDMMDHDTKVTTPTNSTSRPRRRFWGPYSLSFSPNIRWGLSSASSSSPSSLMTSPRTIRSDSHAMPMTTPTLASPTAITTRRGSKSRSSSMSFLMQRLTKSSESRRSVMETLPVVVVSPTSSNKPKLRRVINAAFGGGGRGSGG
jgi:alpha-tubulin suppressor-like RCC1 family protein